jgi:PiT family inorganic phosphate transporter
VIVPAILSPFIAGAVALLGTFAAYKMIRWIGQREARTGYRHGQVFSASLVSLAHGTNDAQKTMGVISLALIANGDLSTAHFSVPLWVKLICATAIAGGTATGGWRIINTMGNRITNVESPQGFAAESATASVILASTYYGYPLSTTQVVSGGVLGAGLGKKLASVHWRVIGQMATAWVFTIPAAAVLGGFSWEISNLFGAHTDAGSLVIALLAAAGAYGLFKLAQRSKVTAADLDRTNVSVVDEAESSGVAPAAATS